MPDDPWPPIGEEEIRREVKGHFAGHETEMVDEIVSQVLTMQEALKRIDEVLEMRTLSNRVRVKLDEVDDLLAAALTDERT
jgi:hypothetical protein